MNSLVSGQDNQFFGQKVSKPGINVNNAGDNELIYKNDYSTTLYYDTNGVPTVLLGLRGSTNPSIPNQQGLFVSKPGIDVTQATDSQLIFNSSQNIFKIVEEGTTSIPFYNLGTSQLRVNSLVIPHGLSYIPILQAYAQIVLSISLDGSTFTPITAFVQLPWFPSSLYLPDSAVSAYNIVALVDDTNIYFSYEYITNSSGGFFFPEVPIRYYLLQETAD